jgi:hypothetical protein
MTNDKIALRERLRRAAMGGIPPRASYSRRLFGVSHVEH